MYQQRDPLSLGWLDENRRPEVRAWIRRQLVGKMGKDYSFDVRRCFRVHPVRRIYSSRCCRNFRSSTTPGSSAKMSISS
jgi:hypothetical protein